MISVYSECRKGLDSLQWELIGWWVCIPEFAVDCKWGYSTPKTVCSILGRQFLLAIAVAFITLAIAGIKLLHWILASKLQFIQQ